MPNIKNLVLLRQHFDISQAELASMIGMSQPHYNMIEKNKRGLSIEKMKRASEIFCITIDELFFEENTNKLLLKARLSKKFTGREVG